MPGLLRYSVTRNDGTACVIALLLAIVYRVALLLAGLPRCLSQLAMTILDDNGEDWIATGKALAMTATKTIHHYVFTKI